MRRVVSLLLAFGMLIPISIVAPVPTASAAADTDRTDTHNIVAVGPVGAPPLGDVITVADVTPLIEAAAAALWAGVVIPAHTIDVGNLDGDRLASVTGTVITIDDDAAGRLWHLDDAAGPATADDGVDLVTVLAHELGHLLGFDDLQPGVAPQHLMVGEIAAGEARRVTVGAHTWTTSINGAATLTVDATHVTVATSTMPLTYVSDVIVNGGNADDTLTIGDAFDVAFRGGNGDDTVRVTATDDFDITIDNAAFASTGNRLEVARSTEHVAAGTGTDRLVLAAGGARARLAGEGSGTVRDPFGELLAQFSGVEQLDAAANAATDEVSVDSVDGVTRPSARSGTAASLDSLTLGADDRFVVEVEFDDLGTGDPLDDVTYVDRLTVDSATLAGEIVIRQTTGSALLLAAGTYLASTTVAGAFDEFTGLDLDGGNFVRLSQTAGATQLRSLAHDVLSDVVSAHFPVAGQGDDVYAFLSGALAGPVTVTAELAIEGQQVSGEATFDGTSAAITVAIADVAARLGDPDQPIATIDGGATTLTLTFATVANTPDVLTGAFTGTVSASLDQLTLSGGVAVDIDTTNDPALVATMIGGTLTVAGESFSAGSLTLSRTGAPGFAEVRIGGLAGKQLSLGAGAAVVTAAFIAKPSDSTPATGSFVPTLVITESGVRLVALNPAGDEVSAEATLTVAAGAGVTVDSSVPIASVTRSNNLVSVTTTVSHGLNVGDTVIVDSSNGLYDGTFTIRSVASPTRFQYARTGADDAATNAGGSITVPMRVTLDTTVTPGVFKISASRVTVTAGGQTFSSAIDIDELPAADGTPTVLVHVSGLSAAVGGGGAAIATVTNGSGTFVLTGDGIAGSASGSIALAVAGLSLTAGAASFEFNTTDDPVNAVVASGTGSTTVSVPGGQYVRARVTGAQATLTLPTLGAVTMAGNLVVERSGSVTALGVSDLAVTAGGASLFGADGAFLVTPTGIAGVLSGSASVAVGGVAVGGRLGLRINSTGAPQTASVTVDGRTVSISFTAPEVLSVFGSVESLALGSFATIQGAVTFDAGSGEATIGTGTVIFVGEGPLTLDDGTTLNPSARGLRLVVDATGATLTRSGSGSGSRYRISVGGALTLLGFRALSGTAAVATLHFDTITPNAERLDVTTGTLGLDLDGQMITIGTATITRHTTTDGRDGLAAAITGVTTELSVTGAASPLVSVDNGVGALLLLADGVAATLSADVTVAGSATSVTGSVSLNTTGRAIDEQIGGVGLTVGAGSYLRVAADIGSADALDLGAVSLSGSFVFEAGTSTIHVSVHDAAFDFGAVSISGVNGSFDWDGSSFAGALAGTVQSSLAELHVSGTVAIAFNGSSVTAQPSALTIEVAGYDLTGTVAIGRTVGGDTTFDLTGGHVAIGPISLDIGSASLTVGTSGVSATISVSDLAVNTSGFSLSGDLGIVVDTSQATPTDRFAIRFTDATIEVGDVTIHVGAGPPHAAGLSLDPSGAVLVTLTSVSFTLDDFTASISSASFLVSDAGVAGTLALDASAGITLSSSLSSLGAVSITSAQLELNTFPHAIAAPALPAGPYVRLAVTGFSATIDVDGTTFDVTFDAVIEHRSHPANGPTPAFDETLIAISELAVADGPTVLIEHGRGALLVAGSGIAGVASGSTAFGPASIGFNATGIAISRSIVVGGATFAIDLAVDEVTVTAALGELDFGGVAKLQGTFTFGATVNGRQTFGATGATLYLGSGPFLVLREARVGVVKVIGAPNKYAVVATGTIELRGVPGVVLTGSARIEFNDTGTAIDQTINFTVGGANDSVRVLFADGSLKNSFAATTLTVDVAGQRLQGAASFTEVSGEIDVQFTNVDLRLAGGLAVVNDANGHVRIGADGISLPGTMSVSGTPAIAIAVVPGLSLTVGSASLSIDTTDSTPSVGVSVTGGSLTIAGVSLTNASFSIVANGAGLAIVVTSASITMPGVTIAGIHGQLLLADGDGSAGNDGVAGRLSATVTIGSVSGLTGTFSIVVSTRSAPFTGTLAVGDMVVALDLPAGPFLRVEAAGASFVANGVTVSGDLVLQRLGTVTAVALDRAERVVRRRPGRGRRCQWADRDQGRHVDRRLGLGHADRDDLGDPTRGCRVVRAQHLDAGGHVRRHGRRALAVARRGGIDGPGRPGGRCVHGRRRAVHGRLGVADRRR